MLFFSKKNSRNRVSATPGTTCTPKGHTAAARNMKKGERTPRPLSTSSKYQNLTNYPYFIISFTADGDERKLSGC